MNILFVCTGNQCRSVMGEYLLRNMLAANGIDDATVSSAGTLQYPPHPADPETVKLLQADGIDASHHRSTPLTEDRTRTPDLILCFEREQVSDLVTLNPLAARKTFLFEDFVNACTYCKTNNYFPNGSFEDKVEEVIADVPMVRPFLPKAVETEDPHRKDPEVFARVYGEVKQGLLTMLSTLR